MSSKIIKDRQILMINTRKYNFFHYLISKLYYNIFKNNK